MGAESIPSAIYFEGYYNEGVRLNNGDQWHEYLLADMAKFSQTWSTVWGQGQPDSSLTRPGWAKVVSCW
jgi:hypothetical protein